MFTDAPFFFLVQQPPTVSILPLMLSFHPCMFRLHLFAPDLDSLKSHNPLALPSKQRLSNHAFSRFSINYLFAALRSIMLGRKGASVMTETGTLAVR